MVTLEQLLAILTGLAVILPLVFATRWEIQKNYITKDHFDKKSDDHFKDIIQAVEAVEIKIRSDLKDDEIGSLSKDNLKLEEENLKLEQKIEKLNRKMKNEN